uniref:oligopeptide/dipeptide ABC transporter ATP-binding protein n=1 Tax=Roseovarius sp. TaxID=1486281 RepID=UPI003564A7CB
ERPSHPYTRMLLAATPSLSGRGPDVEQKIQGSPPSPFERIEGCAFASRCSFATERCMSDAPSLDAFTVGDHRAACWHAEDLPDMAPAGVAGDAAMSLTFRKRMELLRRAHAEAAR